jgi:hypothetical protein
MVHPVEELLQVDIHHEAISGFHVSPCRFHGVVTAPSGWLSGFGYSRLLAQVRLPRMRFLFVGPGLCLPLPSDPASRRQPLRFGSRFPSPGSVEDFHLQVRAPCRAHITKGNRD